VYFYGWVTIQFAFQGARLAAEHGALGVMKFYAESFIEPFGTLWFIYLLRSSSSSPKLTLRLPPLSSFALAAALESRTSTPAGP